MDVRLENSIELEKPFAEWHVLLPNHAFILEVLANHILLYEAHCQNSVNKWKHYESERRKISREEDEKYAVSRMPDIVLSTQHRWLLLEEDLESYFAERKVRDACLLDHLVGDEGAGMGLI